MGFAAGLANQIFLPIMGGIYDSARIAAAGGVEQLERLSGVELEQVVRIASAESFRATAVIPLLLLPVFALIWWNDRRAGRGIAAAGGREPA
jgi:hypothetical protein